MENRRPMHARIMIADDGYFMTTRCGRWGRSHCRERMRPDPAISRTKK